MESPTPGIPNDNTFDRASATLPTMEEYSTNESSGQISTMIIKMPGSGMTVFSRYKLQRILGRGGMGVVWLADDLKLERPVALKFLPSLIGLDPAAVKELKTETRRGLDLSHPNIVRIYDFVDDEDAAAISMEFVDGKTLSELRLNSEHSVFTTEELSRWLPGICDALDYAHFQRKIVHRDLKPANIMLADSDMVAKIADFGIARSLADTMSRLSAAKMGNSGTLPYMSPQQAMGERPMPTDDVYSLGATIYELLTSKPPFYRGDLPMQIQSKTAPSMMERRLELEITGAEVLPKLWEEAIAACLHKEPQARPSCAGALAEMLGLKTSTVTVRSQNTSFETKPAANTASPGSRPKMPQIAAIAAAVTVIGGGVTWYLNTPKESVATTVSNKASSVKSAPENPVPAKPAPAPIVEPKVVEAPAPEPEKPMPTVTPAAPVVAAAPAVAMPSQETPPMPTAAAPATVSIPAPAMTAPAEAPVSLTVPLPSGTFLSPELTAQISTQPVVAEPPNGFWNIEQIFPSPPFASYSNSGKRFLLFRTQTLLKEKSLYTSSVDGREGKGTHAAIQLFQAKSGLKLTGMLDVPTLAALQLSTELDNNAWTPPSNGGSSTGARRAPGGGRYGSQQQEEPSFLERTGGKLKGLFGK